MSTAPVEANSNDVDIEKRLRFVHKIARDVFGFEVCHKGLYKLLDLFERRPRLITSISV